jgi:hypothetical protein
MQLHGADDKGTVVLRRNIHRDKILKFFANLPHSLVGVKACATSAHWAADRVLRPHRAAHARQFRHAVSHGGEEAPAHNEPMAYMKGGRGLRLNDPGWFQPDPQAPPARVLSAGHYFIHWWAAGSGRDDPGKGPRRGRATMPFRILSYPFSSRLWGIVWGTADATTKKGFTISRKPLSSLVRPEGFEPPTYGFVVRRSIQLSYGRLGSRVSKGAAREGQAFFADSAKKISTGLSFLWDLNVVGLRNPFQQKKTFAADANHLHQRVLKKFREMRMPRGQKLHRPDPV